MRLSNTTAGRTIDGTAALCALLVVTTVNEAMLLILPSFVGAIGDDLSLTSQRTGILASADLIGIALSTATAPWWLRRVSWRKWALWSLAGFVALNAACIGLHTYTALVAARVVVGALAGIGYAIGLAGIVDTKRADRNLGLLLVVQVLFSAAGLYVVDVVPVPWRLDSVYVFILVWAVPCLGLAWRHFPDNPCDRPTDNPMQWRRAAARGLAVTAGAGSYFLMIGGVWGYLEGVAREAGLTLAQTGQALSLGLLVSLLGAGAATVLGLRAGRSLPLVVSAVVQAFSLFLLIHLRDFANPIVAFVVINAVFQIIWSFIIPYFMIMFGEVDETGRFVPMYGMITHLTLAIGPYAGALLVSEGNYDHLLWAGIILIAVCYACFLGAAWIGHRTTQGSDQAASAARS